jgi:hypothetical protein
MILLRYIVALLATHLLPALATPEDPAPLVGGTSIEQTTCTAGKCCEFKLRLYQRCVPTSAYGENKVQTWPRFYDFLYKNGTPITPIKGDYNMKACLVTECGLEGSIGNITGPGDFYMRWQYQEDNESGDKKGKDKMTYWFDKVDHDSLLRCKKGDWTQYHDQLRLWVDDCRTQGEHFANRTRVC